MLTYLSSPLRSKRTYPSEVANSVWSVPSPTLDPGLNRVPRCRTMMLPAVTNCPPKRLTPSRWALESRPLRELPTPFLCAMSLCLDLGDADRRHDLPVPALPPVVLPSLELDHEDLGALLLGHDLAGDPGRRERSSNHTRGTKVKHDGTLAGVRQLRDSGPGVREGRGASGAHETSRRAG